MGRSSERRARGCRRWPQAWAVLAALFLAPLAHAAAAHPVEVKVVYAHRDGKEIDPRLKELAKQLEALKFSTFLLKDSAELKLEPGASGRMQVPGGEWMQVQLVDLVNDASHPDPLLRLMITVEKLEFKTTVQIAEGATLVVRGPDHDKGTLILVITRPKR